MTIETNAWTHPTTGQTRYYINGVTEKVVDMQIHRYKSGNICGASIMGETISNNRARDLSAGKLWADEEGNLHLDHFGGVGIIDTETALEKIADYIAENGGLDFIAERTAEEAEEAPAQEEAATEADTKEETPAAPAQVIKRKYIMEHAGDTITAYSLPDLAESIYQLSLTRDKQETAQRIAAENELTLDAVKEYAREMLMVGNHDFPRYSIRKKRVDAPAA